MAGRNLYLCLVTLLCLFFSHIESAERKTVCLNMIVKNESPVIRRCLATVKPLIDYWVIVDTGSTDGTQGIIREFMSDVPGELIESPWVNFAHNRNEALDFAKGKADYVILMDADDVLVFAADYELPALEKDGYYIPISYGGTKYSRIELFKNDLNWRWEGILHEYISSSQAVSYGTLENIHYKIYSDGARSLDPNKYKNDAQILEKALQKDPKNQRNTFYLAQSYSGVGEYEKAIEWYNKRIALGGWEQEVYWSMLQVGVMQQLLQKPADIIINSYYKAFFYRPSRIEGLYRLLSYYRQNGNYSTGYYVGQQALAIPISKDVLFVEEWIYDYGLIFEQSICAYWTGRYREAFNMSAKLLTNPNLPANYKEAVEKNLYWINLKLCKAG